jgi:phosphohistidine phosphatase
VIWLLRHAEAADGAPDADRPLTERGREQARAAGGALAALGVTLDACVSSRKLRAVQTAQLAIEQFEGPAVRTDDRLGGGPFDPDDVAGDAGEDVLLVGHDPDFSMAVHSATGAQVRMKKGGLAAVQKGELVLLLRPAELAAIAACAS